MKRIVAQLLILLLVFVSGCTNQVTGAFLETEGCFPMWQCDEWSNCDLTNEKWSQTRSCFDVNVCGNETDKPSEIEDCEPPLSYEINIGETFSQCEIKVTVESVEIAKNITYINERGENSWLNITSDDYFVIPFLRIENGFRNDIQTNIIHFTIEDENGLEHGTRCPTDDFDNCMEGGGWYFENEFLKTGEEGKGNIIFFVPDETKEMKLFYEMPYISYDCNRVDRLYWTIK